MTFGGRGQKKSKVVERYKWMTPLDQLVELFSRVTDDAETSAFDNQSSSVIRLNNSTIIFMKEVSNVLAMICIWREENFGKSGKAFENDILNGVVLC